MAPLRLRLRFKRLAFENLPPGHFMRIPDGSKRSGRKPRQVRNICRKRRFALKVVQETGGEEWAMHRRAFDTGGRCDAESEVASFAALDAALERGDTGPISNGWRDVAPYYGEHL